MTRSPLNTYTCNSQFSSKTYQLLLHFCFGLFSVSAYLIPPFPSTVLSTGHPVLLCPLSLCPPKSSRELTRECFWLVFFFFFVKIQSNAALEKSLKCLECSSMCFKPHTESKKIIFGSQIPDLRGSEKRVSFVLCAASPEGATLRNPIQSFIHRDYDLACRSILNLAATQESPEYISSQFALQRGVLWGCIAFWKAFT